MSYELGAGLGIAIFGLLLTRSFSASIVLPQGLSASLTDKASSSIGEAMKVAQELTPSLAEPVMTAAKLRSSPRTAWPRAVREACC